MKCGFVKRKISKCLVIGAAGVGKTTIKHLLLGDKLPEKRVSTGVVEKPIRTVSISKAGRCNGSWVKVESDDELMKMIAEAIKSGKVPKRTNIPAESFAVGLPNDNENANSESIHTEFIAAINNTEGMSLKSSHLCSVD